MAKACGDLRGRHCRHPRGGRAPGPRLLEPTSSRLTGSVRRVGGPRASLTVGTADPGIRPVRGSPDQFGAGGSASRCRDRSLSPRTAQCHSAASLFFEPCPLCEPLGTAAISALQAFSSGSWRVSNGWKAAIPAVRKSQDLWMGRCGHAARLTLCWFRSVLDHGRAR